MMATSTFQPTHTMTIAGLEMPVKIIRRPGIKNNKFLDIYTQEAWDRAESAWAQIVEQYGTYKSLWLNGANGLEQQPKAKLKQLSFTKITAEA